MNRRGFLSIIGALVASAQCLFGKGEPAPAMEAPPEAWTLRIEPSEMSESGFQFHWEKGATATPVVTVERELSFREKYALAMKKGPISEEDFRTPGFFGPEMQFTDDGESVRLTFPD